MKLNILIWSNTCDIDINRYASLEVGREIHLQIVSSYLDVVGIIKKSFCEIDLVIAFINVNDIQALYETQKFQKEYNDLPLVSVFDTGCRNKAIQNTIKIISMLHPLSDKEKSIKNDSTINSIQKEIDVLSSSDNEKCSLTRRQTEVLKLIVSGKSNKQIARDLKLSEGTVKLHCMAIFREIGVLNRTQAAVRAEPLIRLGFI